MQKKPKWKAQHLGHSRQLYLFSVSQPFPADVVVTGDQGPGAMMAVERGNSIEFLDNLQVFLLFIFQPLIYSSFKTLCHAQRCNSDFLRVGGGGLGRPWSPNFALARENGDTIKIDRLLQVFIISMKRFVCC